MSTETHFGFEKVAEAAKAGKVREVFDRVAGNYDLMNDLMSLGLHRAWKAFAITLSGVSAGDRVLDVAAGRNRPAQTEIIFTGLIDEENNQSCLLYTSPSPRDS